MVEQGDKGGLKEDAARKKKGEEDMSSLKMRRMMTDYEQQIPEPELRDTHETQF